MIRFFWIILRNLELVRSIYGGQAARERSCRSFLVRALAQSECTIIVVLSENNVVIVLSDFTYFPPFGLESNMRTTLDMMMLRKTKSPRVRKFLRNLSIFKAETAG